MYYRYFWNTPDKWHVARGLKACLCQSVCLVIVVSCQVKVKSVLHFCFATTFFQPWQKKERTYNTVYIKELLWRLHKICNKNKREDINIMAVVRRDSHLLRPIKSNYIKSKAEQNLTYRLGWSWDLVQDKIC